jgi:hypothetical protein
MTVCGGPLSRSLMGVKRTCLAAVRKSACDPKRTSGGLWRLRLSKEVALNSEPETRSRLGRFAKFNSWLPQCSNLARAIRTARLAYKRAPFVIQPIGFDAGKPHALDTTWAFCFVV